MKRKKKPSQNVNALRRDYVEPAKYTPHSLPKNENSARKVFASLPSVTQEDKAIKWALAADREAEALVEMMEAEKRLKSINAEIARDSRNKKHWVLESLMQSAADIIHKKNRSLKGLGIAHLIAEKLLRGRDDNNSYIAEICKQLKKFPDKFSLNRKEKRREDEEEWKIEAAEYIRRRITTK